MNFVRKARELSGFVYAVAGYIFLVGALAIATVYRDVHRTYEKTLVEQKETRESQSPLETEKLHETSLHNRTP